MQGLAQEIFEVVFTGAHHQIPKITCRGKGSHIVTMMVIVEVRPTYKRHHSHRAKRELVPRVALSPNHHLPAHPEEKGETMNSVT